ncbi:hypothetical protein [Carbonactinospora thermoautotrophica]|uniref:hypothetical protein n=1 Tax=Carbonactinospora thermoautotrophica TaxID=1469144 RepID=UPI003DA7F834
MSVADLDEQQHRLVLTAHPLQRVGAYALAELTGAEEPEKVTPEGFRTAVEKMTADAVRAAKVRDTKAPDGFWLKVSLSFFPNSKMNHNAQLKKSDEELDAGIREWRTPPELASWPGVRCVLCGREAVGFYGKVDVPLAESHLYRNTTPRGHAGLALCWPCVCSFHALPYGCRLTGGPSIALHSWDERFLARVVSRQVERNHQHIVLGRAADKIPAREVVALHALRHYGERLTAGVELLVFSNNNKGQTLEIHSLEQPLAEWLRKTARRPELRQGFAALLRAHAGPKSPGVVGLVRCRGPGRAVFFLRHRGDVDERERPRRDQGDGPQRGPPAEPGDLRGEAAGVPQHAEGSGPDAGMAADSGGGVDAQPAGGGRPAAAGVTRLPAAVRHRFGQPGLVPPPAAVRRRAGRAAPVGLAPGGRRRGGEGDHRGGPAAR